MSSTLDNACRAELRWLISLFPVSGGLLTVAVISEGACSPRLEIVDIFWCVSLEEKTRGRKNDHYHQAWEGVRRCSFCPLQSFFIVIEANGSTPHQGETCVANRCQRCDRERTSGTMSVAQTARPSRNTIPSTTYRLAPAVDNGPYFYHCRKTISFVVYTTAANHRTYRRC